MPKMMGFNERRVQFDWHNQRPEAFGYKFKSKQEYRWAQYLNLLRHSNNEIVTWEYEPRKFQLKTRYGKEGVYTPDFRVLWNGRSVEREGECIEWHEVKTSLRQKDVTRFKWFKADYPDERIILVLNSCPTKSVKQIILLDNARKYIDDVIFAGPILRKLGI